VSEILAELVRFNTWSNLKLIEACRPLTREQLAAVFAGTYGSILATFVHYLGAEQWALEQLTDRVVADKLVEGASPDFETLAGHAAASGEALAQIAAAVAGDYLLASSDPARDRKWPASIVFAELVSHSLEHRTQIMTAMTHLGVEPPYLGAFIYAQEMGKLR